MTNQEIMAPEPPDTAYESLPGALPATRAALPDHANVGTIAIEQDRAIAEAQGKLIVAQRCKRNVREAEEEILRSCQEMSLAGEAFYSYSRGGETVRGPSIRLAEELARCWGNVEYGIRELSQKPGVSEMQAFAWDLQRNTLSTQTFTVNHVRDVKGGGKALTTQRDIYELTANMGGRRLRARILAIMPKWLVALAIAECEKTIRSGDKRPIAERGRTMLAEFLRLNVSREMIEAKLGKSLDKLTDEDMVTLRGLFTSIRDGQTTIAEQFSTGDGENKTGTAALPGGGLESVLAETVTAAKQSSAAGQNNTEAHGKPPEGAPAPKQTAAAATSKPPAREKPKPAPADETVF